MPLNASNTDVRVNCIEYWEMGDGKVQPCSWVTDVRVSTRNVSQRMRGGRARWKMAHATCTPLNNQGDTFAHPDGHGEHHLAVGGATLLRLALVVDHTQQRCWAFCRAVWATLGSKRLVWERLRAVCAADHREAMRALLEALLYGHEKHRPLVRTETASCPPVSPHVAHRASGGLPSSPASSASITQWPCLHPPIAPLLLTMRQASRQNG